MAGYAAISGGTVGSKKLWMGLGENPPSSATDNHHHGDSEAGIARGQARPQVRPAGAAVKHPGTGAWRNPLRFVRLRLDATVDNVPPFGEGPLATSG
ncbi:hypothetical protein [Streptomyces flavidovirens]|uniref:hypothetical protein n=1 Tax=Streptomyces flavidovirens TaxID=67298 RepID=UPI003678F2B2